MRCSICNKPFYYDLSFKDLFYFNFVCSICTKYLVPKLLTIPIDYGYQIYYYYFTDDETLDEKLEHHIYNRMIGIILKRRDSIVLFLDEYTLPFLKYFSFKMDITLISIVFLDLEYLLFTEEE